MNPSIIKYTDIFKHVPWKGQEKFSDGVLQTDDGSQFPIHRVILCRSSEYFRGLFSFDYSRNQNITISEIDSNIMDQILVYIYTGKASINQENVWDLMVASDYLLVEDLLQECRCFALQTLNPDNCLFAIATAFKIEKLSLFHDCFRFALVHFEKTVNSPSSNFEHTSYDILHMLLQSESLNVTTERTVWLAIRRWVCSRGENRLCYVPSLLASIRLKDEHGEEELAMEIVSHEIVAKNPFYCDLLYIGFLMSHYFSSWNLLQLEVNYQLKQLGLSRSATDPRLPRQLSFVARHFVSPSKLGSELFLTFDEQLDYFRHLGDVPFFAEVVVRLGWTLYLFNTWDNTSIAYDLVDDSWTNIAELNLSRYNYSVVTEGDSIFAVGGLTNNYEYTDAIECYDAEGDFWHPVRPMVEMIVSEAVVFERKIYVIGHTFDGDAPAMICQVYDPFEDEWRRLSSPTVLRRGFSSIAFGSYVFVVGGENDNGFLSSVEMYSPDKDCWEILSSLPFAYYTPKAVVVESKMVVFDDNHEDTRFCTISPPVCWNEESRTWDSVDKASSLYGIERYSFCVVEDRDLVECLTRRSRQPSIEWYKR